MADCRQGRPPLCSGGNIAGMQRPRSIIQNPTKMLVLAVLPPVEALLIIQNCINNFAYSLKPESLAYHGLWGCCKASACYSGESRLVGFQSFPRTLHIAVFFPSSVWSTKCQISWFAYLILDQLNRPLITQADLLVFCPFLHIAVFCPYFVRSTVNQLTVQQGNKICDFEMHRSWGSKSLTPSLPTIRANRAALKDWTYD